jgi:GntR family transcriptional regulator
MPSMIIRPATWARARLDTLPARAHPSTCPRTPASMFHIDPTDPMPVDAQLVRTIRSAIGAGLLEPGEPMPTVRQLAVELKVGANAVSRAYAELQRQGVLATKPGVGAVVSATPADIGQEALLDELSALEDTFLRQANDLGFSLNDVIIHLDSRRRPSSDAA